jgi:hypothetical protein
MSNNNILNQLGPLLASVLPMIPQLLVWVVGFVLAIIHWGRHPRVCVLTTMALVIAAVGGLASRVAFTLIPQMAGQWGVGNVAFVFGVVGFASSCIAALAWGLLLAAVFSGRNVKS